MRNKRRKAVVLLQPGGTRFHTVRIRPWMFAALLLFMAVGYAGYFISFNWFSLDETEQMQKRNLALQNKQLFQRIRSSLNRIGALRDEVGRLESQKAVVLGILGSGLSDKNSDRKVPKKAGVGTLGLDALYSLLQQAEATSARFVDGPKSGAGAFDSVPVLKPIGGKAAETVGYGRCKDLFTNTTKWHNGVDFVAPAGTPVVSSAIGVVTRVDNDRQWGRRIVINHSRGFATVYAHLGDVRVGTGARVQRGQQIGAIGVSGITTGPHLHFEIWKDGVAVNPENYLYPAVDSDLASGVE